ncbi:MAG: M23 family metallopeptidase [Nocardioidaceae bacterium]
MRTLRALIPVVVAAGSLLLPGLISSATAGASAWPGSASSVAEVSTEFQMPFACGQEWEGSTRPTHSPSSLAVDWNRDSADAGQLVVATAPGVVESVTDLGDSSYGLYVVIDHGGGWTTLHAHLLRALVVAGQTVDIGQVIGQVGDSGSSSGAHLHYEQRLNRDDQHAVFDGTRFAYDSRLQSRNCVDVPIAGDWNGDRVSDVGTFSRRAAHGVLRERQPGGGRRVLGWGASTDQPVVGDWNGDGQFEPGVWRQLSHTFALPTARGSTRIVNFGGSRHLAVAGDWNGDGRWDVGTFNPRSQTFHLRYPGGEVSTRVFGSVDTLPLTGDWDGDGRWDVGGFDPVTATFSLDLRAGTTKSVSFGDSGSLPVIGRWNTDATSDLGVWDPATGRFSLRLGPRRVKTIRFGHIR